MSEDDLKFNAETLSAMMRISESSRNLEEWGIFKEFGVTDHKSFMIGMITGSALMRGFTPTQVKALLSDPTVKAMIEGSTNN